MKTFVIIGNNVIQDTFIKAGLYTFNATIKSHLPTHRVGFKGASGWVDVELPTSPNKFTKAHAIFELKEDVSQISLCRGGASTTNPIIVQTPMWTEGNNISTPSPNPADLDESTNNVDIKLSTQILQTNEKIQLIATEEQFNELGQGGVTAFGMIKVMAGDIELKVGKDGVISSINQSSEEIKINADRIRFTGSAEFENAVKNISPEAIRVELGIPFYEFKKENGVTIVETLSIPVNAFRGSERVNIPSSSITKVSSPNGITVSSVVGGNNVTRIITQTSLSASEGTVVLRVPVLGKYYDVDFNFKVVEKPKDGESIIIADLDNENQSISVDTDGTYMFGLPISTKFSIYAGTKSLVLDSLAVQSISGVTATAVKETGIVTVTEVAKTVPDKIDLKITGKATVNSIQYTREAYLTINKIKRGEDGDSPILYELQPSVSQIKKLANGTLIPSTISCRLLVTDANGSYATTTKPYFLSVEYSLNNGGTWSSYPLGTSVNTSLISNSIQFRLYQDTSPVTMLDIETIMIVEDGEDGKTPYIGANGNWWVWDGTKYVDSGDKAKGDDGKSPEIRNGYWWAWDGTKWYNTGVKAEGDDGKSPKLYSLLPSTTEIHKNKNGVYSPSAISCKLIRNDENGHMTLSAIPSGYRVWRQIDNGAPQTYTLGATTNTSTISKTISYWIEQISPTTTIDRKDIMVISDGTDGTDGKGISIKGSVDNYNQLLGLTGLSAGDAYFNKSDGKLYIWDGFNFPPNGQGIEFKGEAGKDGLNGVSVSSLIQQYINHDSKTVQPSQNADWLNVMPKYEDGLYMWSRFKMTLSNGQVQYSSYSLLEDFEAMMDASRIKNLVMYGDFSGEMKEIKSSNPVNYYPLGWKVSGLSHDSNGVPSDQNNIAPKIIKINTGLPKGMLAGLRITPKTNLQGIYQNLSSDLVLNEVHTAYVFARKRNASSTAQIRLKYGSIMVTEDLTTTWARYVLKFTPTSQQPFEILFNKTGTWTANDEVEISKIQLAQTELIFDYRQFSYVENAFAGSTSIEGGVVATNMVILNNEGGEIRSYVSGIDANPYAFAAGVSGFGTDLEERMAGIKHDGSGNFGGNAIVWNTDGSGHLANGNILWDEYGNAELNGYIKTNSGGDRIEINPNTRRLNFISTDNYKLIEMMFDVTGSDKSSRILINRYLGSTLNARADYRASDVTFENFQGRYKSVFSSGEIEVRSINIGTKIAFQINRGESALENKAIVTFAGLPTSASGLSSGMIYREGSNLKIV